MPPRRCAWSQIHPGMSVNVSTVVIWSGHIGSREDHALLLGKDLRKDLVNQGTLR
jgi:hypothetical protein